MSLDSIFALLKQKVAITDPAGVRLTLNEKVLPGAGIGVQGKERQEDEFDPADLRPAFFVVLASPKLRGPTTDPEEIKKVLPPVSKTKAMKIMATFVPKALEIIANPTPEGVALIIVEALKAVKGGEPDEAAYPEGTAAVLLPDGDEAILEGGLVLKYKDDDTIAVFPLNEEGSHQIGLLYSRLTGGRK
jgi:hypothetical protein